VIYYVIESPLQWRPWRNKTGNLHVVYHVVQWSPIDVIKLEPFMWYITWYILLWFAFVMYLNFFTDEALLTADNTVASIKQKVHLNSISNKYKCTYSVWLMSEFLNFDAGKNLLQRRFLIPLSRTNWTKGFCYNKSRQTERLSEAPR